MYIYMSAQEWDNRPLVGNMGWERDSSMAKVPFHELQYPWYK